MIRTEIPSFYLEEKYGYASKKRARIEFDYRFPDYTIENWHDQGSNGYEFRARRSLSVESLALSHGNSLNKILDVVGDRISKTI